MKILALDTAASACSVAISEQDKIIAHDFEEMKRGHASALIPMVEKVILKSGFEFGDLDGIGVTIGPGAFTGLRIALSAARAFGLAHEIPVVGVTTMEVIAKQASLENKDGVILVSAMDAKRADIYAQSFEASLDERQAPIAALPEDLPNKLDCTKKQILICGDCFERVAPNFEEQGCTVTQSQVLYPDARFVAEIALKKITNNEVIPPRPLYIRPPDAVIPKNAGRLRP